MLNRLAKAAEEAFDRAAVTRGLSVHIDSDVSAIWPEVARAVLRDLPNHLTRDLWRAVYGDGISGYDMTRHSTDFRAAIDAILNEKSEPPFRAKVATDSG